MASYFRVMLGPRSIHAPECLTGGFIGTDFGSHARSRATSSDGDVGQGALGSEVWAEHAQHGAEMVEQFNLSPTHLGCGPPPESGRAASFCPASSRPEPLRGRGRIRIFLPPAGDPNHHHDRSMWDLLTLEHSARHFPLKRMAGGGRRRPPVPDWEAAGPGGSVWSRASRHSPAHIRSACPADVTKPP